ncbi:glycosyltransferase family 2 protein [Candidatus Symbiobacter mobilis]|uniref:Cell wall biogenesis glycosyltransferase n=1 Tax=Candidatus Symbiobacter mobilis CR TaxID=946483 RepID=U5NB40_9BURK|nr:glycosyltransferase family 2 protein [Candidatus Symbiobacter mobilis]AGX87448.1 cell wall biogenesis glycosyltransferase [Candidatus Symbiobacter mobilis CR]
MQVSVITCTYNSEPFLADSIASVLAQTYPDIDYLFVDGGSTDGTLQRIAAIERPVRVVHEVRGGISHAMNVGLSEATGDVIAYLHSDDFYLDGAVLAKVVRAMEQHDVGWCYGRIESLREQKRMPENFVAPRYSAQCLLRGNFIPHPAAFVRRDWLERVGGFEENLRYAMDYDLWLKLARLGAPYELDEPLTVFRVHPGSLSSANRLAALREDLEVRLAHCGRRPWLWLESWLRYGVRRHRMIRQGL